MESSKLAIIVVLVFALIAAFMAYYREWEDNKILTRGLLSVCEYSRLPDPARQACESLNR